VASIAARHKVKPEEVREWNDLKNDKLTAGQSLRLEVRANRQLANRGRGKTEDNASKKIAGKTDKANKTVEPRRNGKSEKSAGKPAKITPVKQTARNDKDTRRQAR
jgi:LysM repeat protein